jgi:protein-disulfide isomerase
VRRAFAAAALLAALAPAAAAADPAGRAPRLTTAPADWSRHVEVTQEGGWRMGNPDAPVRLVEYASITCGHCASFAAEAALPLREQVRTGRVSWEVRPFLIFPTDPGIFMLLQCHAAAGFFDTSDALYASQQQWVGQMEANRARVEALRGPAQLAEAVRAAGVDRFFASHGMAADRVERCLTDEAALRRLLANNNRYAERDGVSGTPTFHINGRAVQAHDWATLAPLLNQP